VYQDPNEWRTSRRQIEQKIRQMRMQLETLKVNHVFIIFFFYLNFKLNLKFGRTVSAETRFVNEKYDGTESSENDRGSSNEIISVTVI